MTALVLILALIRSGYDQFTAWVELDVTVHDEMLIPGPGGDVMRFFQEGSYRKAGPVTFIRQAGMPLQMIYGTPDEPRFMHMTHLTVTGRHVCQDDQSLVIGTRSFSVDQVSVTGSGLRIQPLGAGTAGFLYGSPGFYVETSCCGTEGCRNAIGWNMGFREAEEFAAGTAAWSELAAAAVGSSAPVEISSDFIEEESFDGETHTTTFVLRGWIRSLDHLPLEPIPPER